MKLIRITDGTAHVATLVVNDDAVGTALLLLKQAVDPSIASDINFHVSDADTFESALVTLRDYHKDN